MALIITCTKSKQNSRVCRTGAYRYSKKKTKHPNITPYSTAFFIIPFLILRSNQQLKSPIGVLLFGTAMFLCMFNKQLFLQFHFLPHRESSRCAALPTAETRTFCKLSFSQPLL
jgi:hypothetical protein